MALTPSHQPHREILPDLVRAVALMGIAVVNSMVFAYPLEAGPYGEPSEGALNAASAGGVFWLAAGKFYALFSLMFGASVFYQQAAAERAGADFNRRQTRRLIGLGVLGLIHYVFFFLGDILVTYAVLGALLLTMLGKPQASLIRWGLILIAIQVLILLALAGMFAGLEAVKPGFLGTKMLKSVEETLVVMGSGNFLEQAAFRALSYSEVLPGVLMSQGIATFGYFCIGLAFARSGWIADPTAQIWSRARLVCLPLGLLIGGVGAWFVMEAESGYGGMALFGMAILFLAAPGQALGYAGLLAALAQKPGAIVRFISKAGQASLTAYLLQSVIMTVVFSGWGLGLYGQLPAAQVIAIGAATALVSILFAATWMSLFKRGPVEIAFRAWTYG